METKAENIAGHISDQATKSFLLNSITYGKALATVIATGWRVMLLGTAKRVASLPSAIQDYDRAWGAYSVLKLTVQNMPSLYHGYYFNLPGQAPSGKH